MDTDLFDEEFDMVVAAAQAVMNTNLMFLDDDSDDSDEEKTDWRLLPRSPRREFDHARAKKCIYDDYLGPNALFGKEFDLMFRISRERFQFLMEEIMKRNYQFYSLKRSANGKPVPSIEARLLFPLKVLAYGVAPHAFCDYFQLSISQARTTCINFDLVMNQLFFKKYMSPPSPKQLEGIIKLHKAQHKVDGMLGSLDCSHTWWKNCPKAWQGSFQGKEKRPTIVLEAMCDYHLYFWHASYGYCGTLNDLNILAMLPLIMRRRSYHKSPLIPINIILSFRFNM